MNQRDLFSMSTGEGHPDWIAFRDHETRKVAKERLNEIYNEFGKWLPEKDFLERFPREFPARAWELCVLGWLAASYTMDKTGPQGPDFLINVKGQRIWVECVIVTEGNGADAVPKIPSKPNPNPCYSGLSREAVALRYSNAIVSKQRLIEDYRQKNIVGPDDAVVIAVHCGAIPFVRSAEEGVSGIPLLVQNLFGLDGVAIRIADNQIQPKYKENIKKKSNATVSTRGFLEAEAPVVSAVLFTMHDIVYALEQHDQHIWDIVHNPSAKVRLAHNVLTGIRTWYSDDCKVLSRVARSSIDST